jgi:hypothetical protein
MPLNPQQELELLRLRKKKSLSMQNTIQSQDVQEEQKLDDAGTADISSKPDDLSFGTQAAGRGVADMIGGPVDLATLGINAVTGLANKIPGVNIPQIKKPIGGSDFIAESVGNVAETAGYPMVNPDELTGANKFKYNTMRFGAGAGMSGIGAASQIGKVANAADDIVNMTRSQKFGKAFVDPYTKNTGMQVANDIMSGIGAGAGYTAAENLAPESPLAQAMATILGGGVSSVGTNAILSGAASTGKKIASSAGQTGIPVGKLSRDVELPDGSMEERKTVGDAASLFKMIASDPEKASANIRNMNQMADESNMTRLTPGVASDDVGLGAAEVRLRTQNPRAYQERDQKIRTEISDQMNSLRDPNADVTDPQDFSRQEIDRQIGDVKLKADEAQRRLMEGKQRSTDIDRETEGLIEPVTSQRGRAGESSKLLDQQIGSEGALGQRTKIKNQKFEEAAGDEIADVTPIAASLKKVDDEVNKLGFENSGIPKDFVNKIRAAIPDPEKPTGGYHDIAAKDVVREPKQIKLKDISRVRRDVSSAITRARRAGNYDLADNLQTLKTDINGMIDELAPFEDAQKYYREEYAPFFAQGYGKKYRDTIQRADERIDSADPGRIADIFLNGTADAAKDLKKIVDIAPSPEEASNAVRNYMAADLATRIGDKASPRTIANWIKNRSAQLNEFPEIKKEFENLQRKVGSQEQKKDELQILITQLSNEASRAERGVSETRRRIEKGVLGTIANQDPDKYVASIMGSKDRLKKIDEFQKLAGNNQEAKDGFKRAMTDYILKETEGSNVKLTNNDSGPIQRSYLKNLMDENEDALAKVYTPDQMNTIRRAQKWLEQYGNLERRATTGSDTAQKMAESGGQVNKENLMTMAETAFRVKYGVLKAGGIMKTIKGAAALLPDSRAAKADRLIAKAMIDPELAAHLLDTPTREVGSVKWNKRLSYLLGAEAAGRESSDEDENDGNSQLTLDNN